MLTYIYQSQKHSSAHIIDKKAIGLGAYFQCQYLIFMLELFRHTCWIYLETVAGVSMLQGQPQLFTTLQGPVLLCDHAKGEWICVRMVWGKIKFSHIHRENAMTTLTSIITFNNNSIFQNRHNVLHKVITMCWDSWWLIIKPLKTEITHQTVNHKIMIQLINAMTIDKFKLHTYNKWLK